MSFLSTELPGVYGQMGCNIESQSWIKCSWQYKYLLASKYKVSFTPSALVSSRKSLLCLMSFLSRLAWKCCQGTVWHCFEVQQPPTFVAMGGQDLCEVWGSAELGLHSVRLLSLLEAQTSCTWAWWCLASLSRWFSVLATSCFSSVKLSAATPILQKTPLIWVVIVLERLVGVTQEYGL